MVVNTTLKILNLYAGISGNRFFWSIMNDTKRVCAICGFRESLKEVTK